MPQITINIPSTKNWKTTLCGGLAGVGTYLSTMTDPAWCVALGKILVIAGPVLMGIFAKDSNVTGGTVSQGDMPQIHQANNSP